MGRTDEVIPFQERIETARDHLLVTSGGELSESMDNMSGKE